MALEEPNGGPNGEAADAGDASADAPASAEYQVAQATGGEPGTPIADPGGAPPSPVAIDPEVLATLLLALSQGQDLDQALDDMLVSSLERAADLNATPESITAAVNAFRESLVNTLGDGNSAEQSVIFDEDKLKSAADRAVITLNGRYGDIYRGLRSLSPEEIDSITPDATDQKEYERMIEAVQQATEKNLSQAELVARIRALGDVAVKIAKKAPKLAAIL